MFDLLPETEQQFVHSEHRRRKLIVTLLFILATIAVGSVFLAPAYFVGRYRFQELKQTADILQNNIAIANKRSLNATISLANKKINSFEQESGQKFIEIVNGIAALKSSDIKISSFSMVQAGSGMNLTVKGNANDRQSLLDFANVLKEDARYKKVDLPISNFAEESNIDFTLIITVSP